MFFKDLRLLLEDSKQCLCIFLHDIQTAFAAADQKGRRMVGHTLLHPVLTFIVNHILGYCNVHHVGPDLARILRGSYPVRLDALTKKKNQHNCISSVSYCLCYCSGELQ